MNTATKRDRLIEAAAELFHRKGIVSTSLADIASRAEIPIGNVYYYFKTKEELALATLEKRQSVFAEVFRLLEENVDDPRQRLTEAVRYYDRVKEEYTRYGCPIGKMIEEGNPESDPVAKAAAGIFASIIAWAEQQFRMLGHTEQAKRYAAFSLSGIQGATLMAKAFNKVDFLSDEIERQAEWLATLPNKKIFLGKAGVARVGENA